MGACPPEREIFSCAVLAFPTVQLLAGSGGRTRTPNRWTRTTCVANYTTPEGDAAARAPKDSSATVR